MSKRKSGEPGQSLTYDGVLCTITDRSWEREESPQIVTHNGKELLPSTITRYRCIVDICRPGGARSRLVVVPPFLNDQAHLTPVCVETFSPITYTAGIGGTGTLNASVTFAEGGFTRRCFVEELPLSGAIVANPKQAGAGCVPPQWRHVKKTIEFNDNGVIKHIEVEGDTEEERQENARSEIKRIMQKGIEETRRKNQIAEKNRLENGIRLGLAKPQKDGRVIWTSENRPKECPARRGWQKLVHNRETATGVLYRSEWRCWDTDAPYKLLSFVAVIRRHKCYRWSIQIEGEDLTKDTAWLEASDIEEITGAKIRFVNGFVLESHDSVAVAVPTRMTEAEIQAEAVILDVAEAMETDTKQTKKVLTRAQLTARSKGGKGRAQLTSDQIKIIVAEHSFIKNQSDLRKGILIAQRCMTGRWTHNVKLSKIISRKDGGQITGRYVCDVVRDYKPMHG